MILYQYLTGLLGHFRGDQRIHRYIRLIDELVLIIFIIVTVILNNQILSSMARGVSQRLLLNIVLISLVRICSCHRALW